jgi:hypothetical protein
MRDGIFPRLDANGQTVWASFDADVVRPSAFVTFTEWRLAKGDSSPGADQRSAS